MSNFVYFSQDQDLKGLSYFKTEFVLTMLNWNKLFMDNFCSIAVIIALSK